MTVEEALKVLDTLLKPKSLNNVQERVLRGVWEGRAYSQIAENYSYDLNYLRHVGSQLWQLLSENFEEKVTKSNLQAVLRRRVEQTQGHAKLATHSDAGSQRSGPEDRQLVQNPTIHRSWIPGIQNQVDWGEAIDASLFYGRSEELATLEQWVVRDRCRLVALLGMGGIGKTTLSVKLAEQVQDQFEYLIWRSLRNLPPVEAILLELIRFLSNQKTNIPETINGQLSRLIEQLRSSRCLLLLDNAESILQSGGYGQRYREGYEGYGQLLRCVAEVSHQSCLMITSREKPSGLDSKAGRTLPVRSLQLAGLQETAARELLDVEGLSGLEAEKAKLIRCYGGNPLALRIISNSIQVLFDGNIPEFLAQGTIVFNEINRLLDQQFSRLSALEKQIMYRLAINRGPASLSKLQDGIVPPVSKPKLLEGLESLIGRSLIERGSAGFMQQPIVMEYITEQSSEIHVESFRNGET